MDRAEVNKQYEKHKSILSSLNKEELMEWMKKNLPKTSTPRDYEDFYIFYKRTVLSNVKKKTGCHISTILKDMMGVTTVDEKSLGLNKPTPIELTMAMELKSQKIPYIHHFPLGSYELDFAIQYMGKRVDVECDGREFHKLDYKQERRDQKRDTYVISQGWIPLRFSGSQIQKNISHCVGIIKNLIKIETPNPGERVEGSGKEVKK